MAISNNRADPSAHLADEGARMVELLSSGIVEQAFVKADYSGAVLVAEAPDAATLQEALDTLPLAVNGVTTFTLTEIVGI